ncbi:MAG: shikimate dehydrogenase [Bacteroidaceae bacterium]|nr:shikimate dehydrogenase [Bacteroidaceae bacterium]
MDRYGIIGFPLGHSFSRAFFTEKFQKEHIDAEYVNFEIPSVHLLPEIIRSNPHLRGLNVTLPYKEAVIPMLDSMSDEAREIGAVNVIQVREGRLKGFNSDIIGFMGSLRPLLKPWHQHALVLGTGGASRAIRVGLERLGLDWTYVSRTAAEGRLTYSALTPEVMEHFQVIVNCSPVGMFPKVDVCPDIPYHLLSPRHLLYDLVYNPEETLFLKRGAQQGATIKNGLEMLHLQALASWEFWNER